MPPQKRNRKRAAPLPSTVTPRARLAVGYVRVSTEEMAREGLSLAAQEERLRGYCRAHGFELVAILRDEGVSAGKPLAQRPAGAQLLRMLRQGKAGHVVGVKLDRLFRNTVDCLATSTAWDETGVALHLLDFGGGQVDTSTSVGKLFLTMAAGFAQFEQDRIRERTRDVLAHKRAKGERLGTTPLGFTTPRKRARMKPGEEELEVVRYILRRRGEDGASYRAIAAELTDLGHPTKRGGKWHPGTVGRIWEARSRYGAHLALVA